MMKQLEEMKISFKQTPHFEEAHQEENPGLR